MGLLNVLKGKWDGKVGQTVGAKWKNRATLRTYSVPANPNTQAQQEVRGVFKQMTSFVALFADFIKYDTSLDTRGQSVRNAIIQLNKEQIQTGTFDKTTLLVNRGGLPNVTAFSIASPAAGSSLAATFTKPAATNITQKAKIVAVAIDQNNLIAGVGVAPLEDEAVTIDVTVTSGASIDVYYYIIDYRGSARVGSRSGYLAVSAT